MVVPADTVSAAILAGGKSTRMGRDKAMIPIDGVPMIGRILGTLQKITAQIAVISNRTDIRYLPGIPVYPDLISNRGPAAGIHSALVHARTEKVLIVPCDMPFLSEELFRYILGFPDPGDALVIEADGIRNPLCGLYHRRILPLIEPEIRAGRHTPQHLLDLIEARTIALTPALPFFTPRLAANINDETDLRNAVAAPV